MQETGPEEQVILAYLDQLTVSVSVKGSNVSIIDMQNSSTNGLPCDNVLEGYPLCIVNIF